MLYSFATLPSRYFLFLVFLGLTGIFLVLPYSAQAGINDGLVSYWKYDEGADDTCAGDEDVCDSQGSNHGERAGASGGNNKPQWSNSVKPTLATDNPYAMNFDGTDDQVTGVGDVDFLENKFSISAWIRPEAWGVAGDQYIHNILCSETVGTDATLCFRIGSQGSITYQQRLAVMIWDDDSETPRDFESSSNLTLDTWTHVAVTFDGTDVKFYINGVLDRTQTPSPAVVMKNSTNEFRMGAATNSVRFFEGSIDELRLYDPALTQTELDELATNNPGISTLSPADDAVGVGVNSNLVA